MSETPDYISPFEGWRLWLASTDAAGVFRLTSMRQQLVWPAREPLVAMCFRRRSFFRARHAAHPDQAPPVRDCRCGIYAISDPTRLGAFFDTDHVSRCGRQWVVGRVSLWGTVVESGRGWRASHAYPKQLYVPLAKRNRGAANEVETHLREYGVPVELLDAAITPGLLKSLRALDAPAAA